MRINLSQMMRKWRKNMRIKILIIYFILCTLAISEFSEIKKYKSYHHNGKIFVEGSHVDGKRIGLWHKYDQEGILSEEYTYVNGESIVGVTLYRSNGIISGNGILRNGVQEGWWNYYDKEGKELIKIEFKNGIREGKVIAYSKYKAPIAIGTFKNQKLISVEILK